MPLTGVFVMVPVGTGVLAAAKACAFCSVSVTFLLPAPASALVDHWQTEVARRSPAPAAAPSTSLTCACVSSAHGSGGAAQVVLLSEPSEARSTDVRMNAKNRLCIIGDLFPAAPSRGR